MKRTVFAAAVILCAPLVGANTFAFAAEAPPTDQFVQKVAISDRFEIETGQLAAKQAEGGTLSPSANEWSMTIPRLPINSVNW
jgi:predicted outer membrane protein